MHSKNLKLGYACILSVGAIIGAVVHFEVVRGNESARRHYLEDSHASSSIVTNHVESSFRAIYENLRTLTFLPSVRKLDRHGTNLDDDDRQTIQQIYNNLANSVRVSEMYIVPVDFDPERIDPVTGKLEEPILMFDEFIIDAGRFANEKDPFAVRQGAESVQPQIPEVEIHEYHEIIQQIAWMRERFPNKSFVKGLDVPIISGPQVITCDNTEFAMTMLDADRSGFIFAVPFFDLDGNLKGVVTATMLANTLRGYLPSENFSLVNTGYDYVSRPSESGQDRASLVWASAAQPDPSLIYSEVRPLASHDRRSPWSLWAGYPDANFFDGVEATAMRKFALVGYSVVAGLVLAALACWALIHRNIALVVKHRDRLVESVDAATMELQTKAEELEQALLKEKELNKLQRQFISMASHEFRTPLTIIDGATQRLESRADRLTPEEATKRAGKIRDAVKRMTQLMESTLTLARMDEGKIAIKIGPCDVGSIVREVCARQQEIAKDHVISCDLKDFPETVQADADALEQVFTNLLSNAVKYSPHAPQIAVVARGEGGEMRISVSDHGLGIDEEDLPRMFERFFRANTSTGIAGTGIGLNLSLTLVKMHGGSITIDSKKGEGSTFTICLPVDGPQKTTQFQSQAA